MLLLLLVAVVLLPKIHCQDPLYSNYHSYAFRMLFLLLVAVVLLPKIHCQDPLYSNYHSCAFQNAVAAVGGCGDVACRVLPGPRPHPVLLLQATQDRLREKGGPEPLLYS
jgi:hypothetical protein